MKMAVMTDTRIENNKLDVEATVANELPSLRLAQQDTKLGGQTVGNVQCENPYMVAENVNVHYGSNHAIKDVTLEIGRKQVSRWSH
jgi:hypothetical protein